MKVNIYYGGRGLIEDPTIYVMNRLTEVLNEIRVDVTRYNLYEEKNGINMLPKTLKDADGVILATTLEWMGIGGYMQLFLDACWLYGDKQKISSLYMLPIVMSNTYGEKDAELTLIKAWEMLGGIPFTGLSAYVDDHVDFETNREYRNIIENKAEMLYRMINQKGKTLPSSGLAVRQNILRSNNIELTPQESEQLSMYVSDDTYVKKQKEDIEELSQIFKEMLGTNEEDLKEDFMEEFRSSFHPQADFSASYSINITDQDKTLVLEVNESELKCYYGDKNDADVIARTNKEVIENLVKGKITFQKAFMSGELSAKGNFKILRTFDLLFKFK